MLDFDPDAPRRGVDFNSLPDVNAEAAKPPGETIEYLYVYPNGFFPDRRGEIDVGDVVVSKENDPNFLAGVTPSTVMNVAAEDGDDLIVLKVTRVGQFIASVRFVAAVSGSGPNE